MFAPPSRGGAQTAPEAAQPGAQLPPQHGTSFAPPGTASPLEPRWRKAPHMPTDAKSSPLPHLTTPEERSESPDQRMAEADVLVTHSRRYAVALEYRPGRMSAPRVLARGMDRCADRVRELARGHGVPTLEDPLLAEALYHHTAPEEIIPEALYHPVARVMAYLARLRCRQPTSYVPLRQPPQLDSEPNED